MISQLSGYEHVTAVPERIYTRSRNEAEGITVRESRFLDEYVIDFNVKRAAAVAEYFSIKHLLKVLKRPKLQAALARRLAEREERSRLKAEFVREYIMDVLQFNPLEFFEPCVGGGWAIKQDAYEAIPANIKRLVEHVEFRIIRGETYLGITFVSKTAALAMAARYTLQLEAGDPGKKSLAWDELAKGLEKETSPATERLLKAYDATANGAA